MLDSLLKLQGYEIENTYEDGPDIILDVSPRSKKTVCPICEKPAYRFGKRTQHYFDLPIHAKRVNLRVRRQRYRCLPCCRIFYDDLPLVDDNRRMTTRLIRHIETEALSKTFTEVAKDIGITEGSVRLIFSDYIKRCEAEFTFATPGVLGIDEIHLLHRPRAIFTNIEKRTIIGVLKDRETKTVAAFLRTLDKSAITCVTTDMWRGYHRACLKALPGVPIVVDKFHVLRMANKALDDVRKMFGAENPAKKKKLLRSRHVLTKRAAKLTLKQQFKLYQIKSTFPLLAAVYDAKEAFYGIYECKDRQTAVKAYLRWRKGLGADLERIFNELLTAVTNWNEPIFAYFDHRFTNATTEALNSLSRKIEDEGRGYSFKVMRAKMLFSKKSHKVERFNRDRFVNYGARITPGSDRAVDSIRLRPSSGLVCSDHAQAPGRGGRFSTSDKKKK